MKNKYQAFFNEYANALMCHDLHDIKQCFKLPFILVYHEPKHVVAFDEEVERKVKQLLLDIKNKGIHLLSPQVIKAFEVSKEMAFVTVTWQFCDSSGSVLTQYTNSYMLSDSADRLQIVTLIVDDKHDLFLPLFH